MNGEFCGALAWIDSLRHSDAVCYHNPSLHIILVDVVDGLVSDGDGSLLLH